MVQAEIRYYVIEKLVLALITLARKLRPYFQCHPIKVVSIPFEDRASKARTVRAHGKVGIGARRVQCQLST